MRWVIYVCRDGEEPKAFSTARTREQADEVLEILKDATNRPNVQKWQFCIREELPGTDLQLA